MGLLTPTILLDPGLIDAVGFQNDDAPTTLFEITAPEEDGPDPFVPDSPFVPSGSWSSADPFNYNAAVDWAKNSFGFTSTTDIKGRLNLAAANFLSENGRWPTFTELVQGTNVVGYLQTLASGTPLLPPMFRVDGRVWVNDPLTGPQVLSEGILNQDPGLIDQLLESGALNNSGVISEQFINVPAWSTPEIQQILASLSPVRRSGGGGRRGGGGGGRTQLVFDRDQLVRQASDFHRELLFEDPTGVEAVVDEYMNEANSFWMTEGGQKDFQTFLLGRLEATSRYKELYRNKPDFMSAPEYLNQFIGTVGRFGLSSDTTRGLVETGARFNISQAALAERTERTRENRLRTQGTFSQKFANQLNQLGALGR